MNRKRFITIVASLSVFCMSVAGTGAVWATDSGSEKFDPQPVSSDWEQKDMKGTYAYFVSGKDWVGVYKYDADDDTPLFAKASDQYAACYETAYSVGSDLYVVKGFAKDVDDIGKVREMVESISYPGNPALDKQNGSDNSGELSGGSGSDTPANTKFKADGTYTGSAVCETYNYNVTVTIVISGDTITSVTAESEAGAQDVQYFNMANAKVPAQLLANQSTSGVDAVSGATKSSNAIKKAFYYAYKSAKK